MKVVVFGGNGLIGSQVVSLLSDKGHDVVAASPSTGVDALTGEGVSAALDGAQVVVDVMNSPSFGDDDLLHFFTNSTSTLLEAEQRAGVAHHVALSIVGADTLPESGYMRAKTAQEALIKAGPIAYSIVRATQFFEFAPGIAAMSTDSGGNVRLPSAFVQPLASAEVARIVAGVAQGEATNTSQDVAGPERFGLDEFIRLAVPGADVVTDESAGYGGAPVQPTSIVPAGKATLSELTLAEWLSTRKQGE